MLDVDLQMRKCLRAGPIGETVSNDGIERPAAIFCETVENRHGDRSRRYKHYRAHAFRVAAGARKTRAKAPQGAGELDGTVSYSTLDKIQVLDLAFSTLKTIRLSVYLRSPPSGPQR